VRRCDIQKKREKVKRKERKTRAIIAAAMTTNRGDANYLTPIYRCTYILAAGFCFTFCGG